MHIYIYDYAYIYIFICMNNYEYIHIFMATLFLHMLGKRLSNYRHGLVGVFLRGELRDWP